MKAGPVFTEPKYRIAGNFGYTLFVDAPIKLQKLTSWNKLDFIRMRVSAHFHEIVIKHHKKFPTTLW